MQLGCHMSIAKGFTHAGKLATTIEGDVFQFFTRNPRGGKAKAIDLKDLANYWALSEEMGFGMPLAHAPYTMNMASAKEETRDFARMIFLDDMERMKALGMTLYNFHPGSHVGQGVEIGIQKIIDILDEGLAYNENTQVLLESMSGKGTEIGSSFDELKMIIEGVKDSSMLGVCFDTCHLYSAGYDIINDLEGVLTEFDEKIGLHRLKAVHLNDSKMPFASHKDRHEQIGKGTLGLEGIIRFINHPKLKHLPFFLETPNELNGYGEEIKLLKANEVNE
jgi:deoxyribonuclease-4